LDTLCIDKRVIALVIKGHPCHSGTMNVVLFHSVLAEFTHRAIHDSVLKKVASMTEEILQKLHLVPGLPRTLV
jgi:alpha/beta superfamily hydrolase